MADNDDASGSRQKRYWEMTMDMEEQPQHRYEGIGEDSTDPEYTTASGVGDDTSDDGTAEADATTDDGSRPTDGNQQKKRKKDWRPSVLGTVKEEFTEVGTNGLPT